MTPLVRLSQPHCHLSQWHRTTAAPRHQTQYNLHRVFLGVLQAELIFGRLRSAQDDAGLTLNLLAAAGSLAEGSPAGALSIVQAGGVEAIIAECGSQQQQQRQQQHNYN